MITDLNHQSRRALPRDRVASKIAVHEDCDLVIGSYSARVPRSSLAFTSWKKKLRARKMNKTIREKIDSKKRKEESRRIKHTT